MRQHQPDPAPGAEPERGFIVAVLGSDVDPDEELGEFRELARTAGVDPVAEIVQKRPRPDERTYVGKGKLVELQRAFGNSDAESLLVDDELTPAQQRRLEDALSTRVVDRTQLILDIFAQHAVSAEGKLQVELAQLDYNIPRMRGMWQHLERLGGGVGTRGPGESQLETDRRLARRRISSAPPTASRSEQAARDAQEVADALADADGGTGRVHERRQVDAAQCADGGRRIRGRSAVRDARSDDAELRLRRQAVPRDGHRRFHPPPSAPAGRRVRCDARGDACRGSRAARGRCVGRRRADGGDGRRGRFRPGRGRRGRAAGRDRAQQGRPRRSAQATAAGEQLSRRASGVGSRRARGSTSCAPLLPRDSPNGSRPSGS